MPPPSVSPQSSRTGLITAVVVFVVLFVTALIFAFYYGAQLRNVERNFADEKSRNEQYASQNDIGDPQVASLIANKDAGGGSALGTAVLQINQLSKLATGTAQPGDRAIAQARITLADVNKRLGELKEKQIADISVSPDSFASAITTLTEQLINTATAKKETETQLAAAKQETQDTIKGREALLARKDEEIAAANKKAQDASDLAEKYHTQAQAAMTQTGSTAQVQLKSAQDQVAAVTNQLTQANTKVASQDKELIALRGKLHSLRIDANAAEIQHPSGLIARIPTQTTVYIDIGQAQSVTPGLTFEVYDQQKGIPALGKNTPEGELPIGKASIEVIRVYPSSSECRVTKLQPGQQIYQGDLIKNLVFDPNTKYKFVVFGNFDLTNSGNATNADAEVIKRLVTQWGGQLVDKVTADTDFVVIGKEPVVPNVSSDDVAGADNALRAKQELDKYLEVQSQASKLSIPILNQNRFLYFTGYFDQATR